MKHGECWGGGRVERAVFTCAKDAVFTRVRDAMFIRVKDTIFLPCIIG